MIERARLLYLAGHVRAAQGALFEALKANPHDALARAFLAMSYKVQGRYAEADREVRQALADGPNESYPHYVRACLELVHSRYPTTIEAAREAIRLDPGFVSSYIIESHGHVGLAQWNEALEPLRRALAQNPEHVAALSTLAQVLRRLNRLDEARTTIESALRLDPADAHAHAIHGWILMDEKRYDEALAAFRESLRADPYVSEGRHGLVEALKATNPWYRALRTAAPVAAAGAIVPAVFAFDTLRLSALHLAFYALVVLSYAAVIIMLLDAIVTVNALKRRFGRASIPRDLRSFATIAGCCIFLNWFAFVVWLGGAGNGPLYGAVVVGSFGIMGGAALALRPSPLRVWVGIYILAFCYLAFVIPIVMHFSRAFRFSNAEDALAAAVGVIGGTWLSLGAIAWLRKRV